MSLNIPVLNSDTLSLERGPRQALKLHLWLFFCLAAACSWVVWLWPLERKRSIYVSLFGWRFDFSLTLIKFVIGNCVPGFLTLVWTVFEGKQHFRRILSSFTNWKISPKWYSVAILLPCGVYLLALDTVLLLFPAHLTFPPPKYFFKSLLMTLPFGPLWE